MTTYTFPPLTPAELDELAAGMPPEPQWEPDPREDEVGETIFCSHLDWRDDQECCPSCGAVPNGLRMYD